jgi:hypothetical protein
MFASFVSACWLPKVISGLPALEVSAVMMRRRKSPRFRKGRGEGEHRALFD